MDWNYDHPMIAALFGVLRENLENLVDKVIDLSL
jgi:hypothetical protein